MGFMVRMRSTVEVEPTSEGFSEFFERTYTRLASACLLLTSAAPPRRRTSRRRLSRASAGGGMSRPIDDLAEADELARGIALSVHLRP
jgi:hypothetical protein